MKSQDSLPPGSPRFRGISFARARSGGPAPAEGWRRLLHLACAAPAFLLRDFPPWLPAACVAMALLAHWAVVAGGIRPAVMRPGERWWSGAVAFAVGVLLALAVLPPEAAFAGWIVLAAGDPAASFVGRRLPLRGLLPGRSLGGTVAFALAAFCALGVSLAWWHGAPPGPDRLAVIAVVAAAGALAELLLWRIDDNLVVPLVAGAAHLVACAGFFA